MLQYCQHLRQHAVYLDSVNQSFQSFVEGVADDSIIQLVCFTAISLLACIACIWETHNAPIHHLSESSFETKNM